MKQSCQDLFILAKLPIVWLIIGCYNNFNIEICGDFALHILMYNWWTQNWNRLKFLTLYAYVDIYSLMSFNRKIILESRNASLISIWSPNSQVCIVCSLWWFLWFTHGCQRISALLSGVLRKYSRSDSRKDVMPL